MDTHCTSLSEECQPQVIRSEAVMGGLTAAILESTTSHEVDNSFKNKKTPLQLGMVISPILAQEIIGDLLW